eukprot:7423596-Lingulodinium_polyedra.AAC.1
MARSTALARSWARKSAWRHSLGPAPSRSRTMPSRTYLLSVTSRNCPGIARAAATAARSSPRCAVCAPATGPAQ